MMFECASPGMGFNMVTISNTPGRKAQSAATRKVAQQRKAAAMATDSSALVKAVRTTAAVYGHTAAEAAELIGISSTYYTALVSSRRFFAQADLAVLRGVADYVGVTVVNVLMMAGILSAADFCNKAAWDGFDEREKFVVAGWVENLADLSSVNYCIPGDCNG